MSRLIEGVLAFQFGTQRDLEQLGRREAPLLELFVEVVGQTSGVPNPWVNSCW